jgi:hypothetical protein
MKVHFAVALLGSALGIALPAFADEVPTAASSTQNAISVDSDGPTGHPAIKDHRAKQSKKQHPKTPEEASGKSTPSSVSNEKQDPPASGGTSDSSNAATAPLSRGLLSNTGITTRRPCMSRTAAPRTASVES